MGGIDLKPGARGKPAQDQDRMSEVRGPCGVENTEMRARELSVLDCLLMGCSRSWELVGQALPLAGMAGRLPLVGAYRSERMPTHNALHVPIVD